MLVASQRGFSRNGGGTWWPPGWERRKGTWEEFTLTRGSRQSPSRFRPRFAWTRLRMDTALHGHGCGFTAVTLAWLQILSIRWVWILYKLTVDFIYFILFYFCLFWFRIGFFWVNLMDVLRVPGLFCFAALFRWLRLLLFTYWEV